MDLHLSSGKTDPAVPLRGLKSTLAGSGQGVRLLWTSMDTPRSDRDIVARNTFHRKCGSVVVEQVWLDWGVIPTRGWHTWMRRAHPRLLKPLKLLMQGILYTWR